ncbi:hypothetical protein KRX19_10480 [Cardiobacteriaceae bacterium TAE3-ERU3]|nr:hypothetical protein [Cardiobacteriaceae bacterium TAE3-ERU3]
MKKMTMTKLGLAAMIAAGSMTAMADDADLRKQLADAQAEVAELKAQLAEHDHASADHAVAGTTATNADHAAADQHSTANLPAGFYVPENLTKVKVDRDDDGEEVELKGELESADIKALASEAQKALQEAGYTVVKEEIDKDDEAKLSYEKVTGNMRETIEVEIDKSWLSDKVKYEVEYEKHD